MQRVQRVERSCRSCPDNSRILFSGKASNAAVHSHVIKNAVQRACRIKRDPSTMSETRDKTDLEA